MMGGERGGGRGLRRGLPATPALTHEPHTCPLKVGRDHHPHFHLRNSSERESSLSKVAE